MKQFTKDLAEVLADEASSVEIEVLDIALPARAAERPIITWHSVDSWKKKRGVAWHAVMGGLAAGLFGYAVMTQSVTMALAVAALGIAVAASRRRPQRLIPIVISEYGLRVGAHFFPFSALETFWISDRPHQAPLLTIRRKKRMLSDLVIDLHDQDPLPVREYLATHLPEWTDREDSLIDDMAHLFH